MELDISSIAAKAVSNQAVEQSGDGGSSESDDTGTDELAVPEPAPEGAGPDDQPDLGAEPAPPQFKPISFAGSTLDPNEYVKSPEKWDELGQRLGNIQRAVTQKQQALAEQARFYQAEIQQIQEERQKANQFWTTFQDPVQGPALAVELFRQQGINIPDALARNITADPQRQAILRQQEFERRQEDRLRQFEEKSTRAERTQVIEQAWKSTGLSDRLFNLWAAPQIGEEAMTREQATAMTKAFVNDFTSPAGFETWDKASQERLAKHIIGKYRDGKVNAQRQVPLGSGGRSAATTLGRPRSNDPDPAVNFDAYIKSRSARAGRK